MVVFPKSTRLLRGPHRGATGVIGARPGLLAETFDLSTGKCTVQAQSLSSSAANAITAGLWNWQSYDKICQATNVTDVSGGGLVASGTGQGTVVTPIPNTTPIVCTAFLVDD